MTLPQPTTSDVSPLGVLGFSAAQERLYRLMLRNSGLTPAALAARAGLPMSELREQLTRFTAAGLVQVRDGVVVAAPPQDALARMVNDEARRVLNRSEQLDVV